MDIYGEAAITRLSLTNFLTYDQVEFCPEPGLNMIIGPNGSGKSSLVCAICLALAGNTKVLGRAQHVKDFIKYGCEFARLEIELFHPDGNIIIERTIHANKSEWKINGQIRKQDDVVSTIGKLNIQVDNLCQFLPQDRVADFAKMSPQELLIGTEQAVGSRTLIENHEKLKSYQKKLAELAANVKSVQMERDQNVQLNQHLEAELQTFREYQSAKTQLNLYEAKIAWLVYDKKREAYLELEKSFKTCAAALAQKRANHSQIESRMEKLSTKLTELSKEETAVELALRKTSETRTIARQEIASTVESIEEIQHQLREQRDAAAEREEKRQQLEETLSDLQKNYDSLAKSIADDNVEETFRSIKRELNNANSQLNDVLAERERYQAKLRNLDNDILEKETEIHREGQDGDQRLQLLRRSKPQVHEVCMWLRNNNSLFKKKIHEPPMAVMQVKSDQAARYLDSAIGTDSLFCFIAEDADDMELFVKQTRKNGWRVNAATAPQSGRQEYRPVVNAAALSDLGVTGFLSDLFEAPDAVFAFLCDNHKLHNIPYGSELLEENSYVLHDKFRMSTFVARDTWVNLIKSRYSTEITRCTRAVKNPKFLHASRDSLLKADMQAKLVVLKESKTALQTQYGEMKSRIETLNSTCTALKLEEKKLKQRLGEFNGLKDTLRVKKSQLERLAKEPGNLQIQTERAEQKQREKMKSFSKSFSTLRQATAAANRKAQLLASVICRMHDAVLEKNSIQSELSLAEQELSANEDLYKRTKISTQNAKRDTLELLERAKILVGFDERSGSNNIELPEEYMQKFEPLSNEISDLLAHIKDEKNRLSLLMPQNCNIEEEYEKRKEVIEQLQAKLEDASRDQKQLMSTVSDIELVWKNELNELVTKVDRKFSEFFSRLGCEGRILIYSGEHEREFDQYGIRIMVRFREQSELCELTPFHQSGGERSVSTVLYMMALQELTVVPFRVVDEINQGMDSLNERRIFEFIVRTAETNNAQYFLITPKLLPDLPYSQKMHIHVITPNSRFSQSEWDFEDILRRRRVLMNPQA